MRRWRGPLVRKGRFYSVPPTAPVQALHDATPALIVRRRPAAPAPRRGAFQPVIVVPVERGGMSAAAHAAPSMEPTTRSGAAMRATSI